MKARVIVECFRCDASAELSSCDEPAGEWSGGVGGGHREPGASRNGYIDDSWSAPDGWTYLHGGNLEDDAGWLCPMHASSS